MCCWGDRVGSLMLCLAERELERLLGARGKRPDRAVLPFAGRCGSQRPGTECLFDPPAHFVEVDAERRERVGIDAGVDPRPRRAGTHDQADVAANSSTREAMPREHTRDRRVGLGGEAEQQVFGADEVMAERVRLVAC